MGESGHLHVSNTSFLGSTLVLNPNGISIGSAVFAQLTADRPYNLQWAALPLKIAPSHQGSGPHLIMVPWANLTPQPKRHLSRFNRFRSAHYSVTDRQTTL